jgi:rhodanese-related sulfurtransferase
MSKVFNNFGLMINSVLHLSAKESYLLCAKGAIILDVRRDFMIQYKIFDVKEVIYCTYDTIWENISLLPKDKPLIIADAVGLHSREIVMTLLKNGFDNVANLAGGIVDWERDGMPIKIDKGFEMSGACVCRLKTKK